MKHANNCTEDEKKLFEIFFNWMRKNNLDIPLYIGEHESISKLPLSVNDLFFYSWINKSNKNLIFSANGQYMKNTLDNLKNQYNLNVKEEDVWTFIDGFIKFSNKTYAVTLQKTYNKYE